MQLLCEMLIGQAKAEGRQLAEIKSALASDRGQEDRGQAAPDELSAELLEN